jgi:hypothetical protein
VPDRATDSLDLPRFEARIPLPPPPDFTIASSILPIHPHPAAAMADSPAKADGGSERKSAGYKSWKKKYRKMRIAFDNEMHVCEELHKQEAKAANTVKRLAIENEYVQHAILA